MAKTNERDKRHSGEGKQGPKENSSASHQGEGTGSKKKTSSRLWTPYGDPSRTRGEERRKDEKGISEEELKKRVEEVLEKLTVADIVLDMTITLSSLAYQKMGIPKEVNAKYRDMEQARLAIDCIDAILKVLSDRVPSERVQAITSTLDNLKLNYAKEV